MSDTMKPYDELSNEIGGRIFKNSKTGKLYQTICIAREVTNCLRPRDVVVYCSMDNPNEIFTRQYNEFFEYVEVGNQYVRRFVEVFAPTEASDTEVNNKECDKLKKNTDGTTQQEYYTCVIKLDKPTRGIIILRMCLRNVLGVLRVSVTANAEMTMERLLCLKIVTNHTMGQH